MGMPSMPELLVVLAIVVLLFGAKKIPDLAQGMGKGIKNFKKAMREEEAEEAKIEEEKKTAEKTAEQTNVEDHTKA
ncbi:twin-arginine translocase TatA/TatE family subunit [Sulfurospirillum sp. 1612]|uniref:twin-arginine translocase TatA/TatE family subunit n=1 Tax=Sulfurospirillum sp. 1612 TaxID=3094835 RepID=UPI002F91EF83